MSDYFTRIERQLVARVETGAAARTERRLRVRSGPALRRPLRLLAPALAVLVVVAVAVAFLGARGDRPSPATRPPGADTITLRARPLDGGPLGPALRRSVPILRRRLAAAGLGGIRVTQAGTRVILTGHLDAARRAEALALAAVPGRLAFYDWEASVVLPGLRSAAQAIDAYHGRAALAVSQGTPRAPVGTAGAMPLAAARVGAGQATHAHGSGPVTIVQAGGEAVPATSPAARFFVLRGRPALTETSIRGDTTAVDRSGSPNVTVRFTAAGETAFRALTARIAHRGQRDSTLRRRLDQHFAVVLDGRLLSVPFVEFTTDPDGILGTGGIELSGGFTRAFARELAIVLRFGALSVRLAPG